MPLVYSIITSPTIAIGGILAQLYGFTPLSINLILGIATFILACTIPEYEFQKPNAPV